MPRVDALHELHHFGVLALRARVRDDRDCLRKVARGAQTTCAVLSRAQGTDLQVWVPDDAWETLFVLTEARELLPVQVPARALHPAHRAGQ